MELDDLEIYKISRELSRRASSIYKSFDWHTKKMIGDQWIRAIDSVGANIAEGFGRFHYLDKNRFNFNARGSLVEGIHWTDLMAERGIISETDHEMLKNTLSELHLKVNNYINSTRRLAS